MARRDPLAVLARLRRLETDQARRLLAERLTRSAGTATRLEASTAAIAAEGMAATPSPQGEGRGAAPADYGLWLVRGLAECERSARLHGMARQAEAEARQALASARAAERAVETLALERDRAVARAAQRAEQARLDERLAARR